LLILFAIILFSRQKYKFINLGIYMKNNIRLMLLTIISISSLSFCRGGAGFHGGGTHYYGGGGRYYGGGSGWGGFGGGLLGGMTGGLIAGSISQPRTTIVYPDKPDSSNSQCECKKCKKTCPECGASLD
jgi:hypothetical protein